MKKKKRGEINKNKHKYDKIEGEEALRPNYKIK